MPALYHREEELEVEGHKGKGPKSKKIKNSRTPLPLQEGLLPSIPPGLNKSTTTLNYLKGSIG